MRRLVLLLLALASLAALTTASANAANRGCIDGFRCVTVTVPLDRSGATPGTLQLPVAVERGTGPVLLALGGGPGQSTLGVAPAIAGLLGAPSGHRIAFVDQRGTGPTALRCPSLQRLALSDFTVPPPGSVEACGALLGARRAFYSTTDTVADLEAVRAALGVERMALLGISYGTYAAERYARAHPERVSAIVLDSVVPQENVDPFVRANLRKAGSALRELCARGACRGIAADPVEDLAAIVRGMATRPLSGRVRTGSGTATRVTLDGPGLFDAMATWASFQQNLFARVPAALAQARAGRPAALLRLAEVARRANAPSRAQDLSWGLHTATLCADLATPWGGPAADPAVREAAIRAALDPLPASTFAPFDAVTASGNGVVDTCRRWQPTVVATPPAPGPLPPVPTLVLAGGWDMSTPSEDARREAARSPGAQLVVVPQAGHSVTTTQLCTQTVLRRFFAGRALGTPCASNRAPGPLPQPRRLADLRGSRADRAREVAALTLLDAQAVGTALGGARFGGLAGGSFAIDQRGTVTMRRATLVAGAPVSGRVRNLDGPGTLRVGGPLNADVTFDARGQIRVRLR